MYSSSHQQQWSGDDNAHCQWSAFSHAEVAALKLIASIDTPAQRTGSNNDNACCHWQPYSHAEIAALKLTTTTVTRAPHM